jgi:phosphoribosylaminoimidazolecarboxamide formyltransferase/IMP cyclohydrolase
MAQLGEKEIVPFDMVVINLYPFEKVIRKEGVTVEEAIENIDIGGPSMLRSSAKNYQFVCVVSDPSFYSGILEEIKTTGVISLITREKLAMAVFEKTSYYDSIISSYFHKKVVESGDEKYPNTVSFYFTKAQELRYGENPHQSAAFYTTPEISVSGVSNADKLQGKELSFNNILDLESAFEIVKEFEGPACSVIKHTNPCGVAVAADLTEAFLNAWAGDPISAFGSIIGFNRVVDKQTAQEIIKAGFVECIIAPGYDQEALGIFLERKNVRLLETGKIRKDEAYDYDMKRVVGGLLIQERDLKNLNREDLRVVTDKKVSDSELDSLIFGWKVVKNVKSNAIVLTQGTRVVGVGAGQMSRVDAVYMAISKAKDKTKGSLLASDAFFPKPDAIELAAENGITAIIQPGGSVKDDEVIEACNRSGVSMLFTGFRHFKH